MGAATTAAAPVSGAEKHPREDVFLYKKSACIFSTYMLIFSSSVTLIAEGGVRDMLYSDPVFEKIEILTDDVVCASLKCILIDEGEVDAMSGNLC